MDALLTLVTAIKALQDVSYIPKTEYELDREQLAKDKEIRDRVLIRHGRALKKKYADMTDITEGYSGETYEEMQVRLQDKLKYICGDE